MSRSHARPVYAALSLFALLLLLGSAPAAQAAPATTITPAAIAPYLDTVLTSVDAYWRQADSADGHPPPSVNHAWVAPGAHVNTACGAQADDNAAFYCPNDDTIYIGQSFAASIYNGVAVGLPGQKAGFGRAAGDFAVAYVVAHEYGHNVQQESGILAGRTRALPTELNADCLAGTWAAWDYGQGQVTSAQVKEALDAALAVGDFDFLNPQHHGTPQERRDALQTGLDGGGRAACDRYLAL
jgi:predicted metalloprotease